MTAEQREFGREMDDGGLEDRKMGWGINCHLVLRAG
jgi:hypothetical protein